MKLCVERLNVTLKGRPLLRDVAFSAAPGQTVGLLGPNGSGKSTLLRCLAGLIPTPTPCITLGATPLAAFPHRVLARRLAFVPQHASVDPNLRVEQIVRLGRTPHRGAFSAWCREDSEAVEQAIRLTQLQGLANRPWRQLSGGERQRCQIARALAQKPQLLLLDEPTNHLDIRHQLALMQLIQELPITVIIALHDLNLAARYCQHLVLLNHGVVTAQGEPERVLTPGSIAHAWRVEARVEHRPSDGMMIHFLPPQAQAG
mgnify:CR=1 FL=1